MQLQLDTGLPHLFLLLVPEQPPQNLTARALGDGVDKLNAALQPLMASFVVLHMLQNGPNRRRVVGTSSWRFHHERLGNLAGGFVRYPDDRAVRDGRVIKQMSFKFGGGNLQTLREKWVSCDDRENI